MISGLRLFAYHGVNPEEKENGQTFELDITLEADLSVPCRTDDVADTVSYARVVKTVTAAFNEEKFDLIEKAAQHTADAILRTYPKASAVEITLKKPEAPVKADFGYVAVCIRRTRDE